MMYTIDLLAGEGVPIRSRPGGIAMACLIVVFPLLLGLGFTSFYMDGQVILSIQNQQLGKLQAAVGALSQAVQKKESLEREKTHAVGLLSDIKTALDGYAQWSRTLEALVGSLSDALVLTRLEARQDFVRRKAPAQGDPTTMVDISVPVRTLRLSVCGQQAQAASEAVRSLQEDLRLSPVLGPLVDTITVSQSPALLDSQEVVTYELECVLKTQ